MWTKTAVEVDLTDRGSRKGWHYAQAWSKGGGPIGYCAMHEPHDTEEQARTCYSRYLADTLRAFTSGGWTGCKQVDCDAPTKEGYQTGTSRLVMLCDEHRNEDSAISLLGLDEPAGDSVGSL